MKKALKPAGFKPETSRLLGIYANTKHNETTFSRFSRLSRRENHLKSKTHKVEVRYSLTSMGETPVMTSNKLTYWLTEGNFILIIENELALVTLVVLTMAMASANI